MTTQGTSGGEYAASGVNYADIDPFKKAISRVGKETRDFCGRRDVRIRNLVHPHGAAFEYYGPHRSDHHWVVTQEGLGTKNFVAERMYALAPELGSHYDKIAVDVALMAVNDAIAHGALPAVLVDEVAAGESGWYTDQVRAEEYARGFYEICKLAGMTLAAGESSSLPYLVNAKTVGLAPAPVLSCTVSAVVAPSSRLITGEHLRPGDRIVGVTSSGIHANGLSLVIKRATGLRDGFLTRLPNGNTLGEETLIPTRSYVALMETLLENEVPISSVLPGTGGGVAKLGSDPRPFSYHIHSWPKDIPPLFLYMRELGVSLMDCLTTFNWGIGYYLFVPQSSFQRTMDLGAKAGYLMYDLGVVETGERETVFGPEHSLVLPPPA